MSFKKEVIEIKPSNVGNGVFSFKNGTPQIEFDIPQMTKFCKGESVRVSGYCEVKMGNGNSPDNVDGTNYSRLDSRTGVTSCVDMVSIGNQAGQTYELVKHYNRLCASLMPLNTSLSEYLSGGSNLVFGSNGKESNEGRLNQNKFSFSMPLLCGILQGGEPIDLHMTRGLHIVLNLAPDNYAIYDDQINGGNDDAQAGGGAYYELSDLTLTFDSIVPDAKGQEAMRKNNNGAWSYNSFSSYYNVITSKDHNATLNLNTSRTIAVLMNMCPSVFLNNYGRNSQLCSRILGKDVTTGLQTKVLNMNSLTFTRSGMRYPLNFNIDNELPDINDTPEAQLIRTSLNSFKKEWKMDNFLQSNVTALNRNRLGVVEPEPYQNDNIPVFNMGICYDHITDNGVNFKGQPFGFRLQSDAEADTPMSVFIFVKHKNVINFNVNSVMVGN